MKYHYIRDRHLSCGYIGAIVLLAGTVLAFTAFSYLDAQIMLVFWIAIALNVAVGIYETRKGLRLRAYALIQPDGIHIMSLTDGERAMISWDEVVDCKYLPFSGNASYTMVITGWNAKINGKPASAFSSSVSEKEAKRHRLDEAAEALVRGEISEEEFKARSLFLIALTKTDYLKCYNMWVKRQGSTDRIGTK